MFGNRAAGGTDVRVRHRVDRQCRQGLVGLNQMTDLASDGCFVELEKNVRLDKMCIDFRFREEILQDVVCRLALDGMAVISTAMPPNPSGRIFVQVKAETTVRWSSIGERRTNVLKDELPRHAGEVDLDMRVAVADIDHSLREIGARGTRDACRLDEGGTQIFDRKLEPITWSDFGEEIEAVAVRFGFEDAGEKEAFERRHVRDRNRGLDDGWRRIIGHGEVSEMRRARRDGQARGIKVRDGRRPAGVQLFRRDGVRLRFLRIGCRRITSGVVFAVGEERRQRFRTGFAFALDLGRLRAGRAQRLGQPTRATQ